MFVLQYLASPLPSPMGLGVLKIFSSALSYMRNFGLASGASFVCLVASSVFLNLLGISSFSHWANDLLSHWAEKHAKKYPGDNYGMFR